jgi:hypothetical protein
MKMKYDLIIEEENFIIINTIEKKPVVWINKEYSNIEAAKKIVVNFNAQTDQLPLAKLA